MKVSMAIKLDLDESIWGTDEEEIEWLVQSVLYGGKMKLFDLGDVGDELGHVEVLSVKIDDKEW